MGIGYTVIMVVIMGGMLWFMSRSQRKQQKERQNLLESMKVGDEVVTIGGLHGVLSEIDKTSNTVTLDCEGIYLTFERGSIRTVKAAKSASVEEPVKEAEKVEDNSSK